MRAQLSTTNTRIKATPGPNKLTKQRPHRATTQDQLTSEAAAAAAAAAVE